MPKKASIAGAVVAGFPSPAERYLGTPLDLNELLVKRPAATYFIRVKGDLFSAIPYCRPFAAPSLSRHHLKAREIRLHRPDRRGESNAFRIRRRGPITFPLAGHLLGTADG